MSKKNKRWHLFIRVLDYTMSELWANSLRACTPISVLSSYQCTLDSWISVQLIYCLDSSSQRCHSLHVIKNIKGLRGMINADLEKLSHISGNSTCKLAFISWSISCISGWCKVLFLGLSQSPFSLWHPFVQSETQNKSCKMWLSKTLAREDIGCCLHCFVAVTKTFRPRYQILWALLMCLWEISLFICQQWQDNEYRFVHSLVCCVMIRIMFDNGLRKMVPNRRITTFHTKLSKLSITGSVYAGKIRNVFLLL